MDRDEGIISEILDKICSSIVKDCPESKEYIQQTAARLLLQGLSQTHQNTDDEAQVYNRVQEKIEELNTAEDGLAFRTKICKLEKMGFIKDRASILKFLLAQSNGINSGHTNRNVALNEFTNLKAYSSERLMHPKILGMDPTLEKIFPLGPQSSFSSADSIKSSIVTSVCANSRNQICLTRYESDGNESKKGAMLKTYSDNSGQFISEHELMQEVIFALQGIESKTLRLEPCGGFRVDTKADLSVNQKQIILRLAEVGYLHNKVKEFCDNAELKFGLMYQSMVSAFREELTNYYKLIAILQEHLANSDLKLSLRRFLVWLIEPHRRLQWLLSVGVVIQYKKGGDLISSVYGFLSQGSPPVQTIVRKLLNEVCRPLLNSISHWVLDGQIEDPFAEFFIEARPDVTGDRLWHEKYRLRESMLPSFITRDQAEKILATGKSIDFLREVCKESPPRISPAIKNLFDISNVESLYMGNKSSTFHAAIETVYKDTSRKVLDILLNKYNFIHHLYAIKRYLLLGQGDFIRHLMELLTPELLHPASKITLHNLSAILESAIRSTNAQYEDPDVLARLDVKTVQNSKDDVGWDIFSLIYHTNGPIGTIFVPCDDQYMALFHSLWTSKRMEFILSALWKNLTTSARTFRSLPGMPAVMQLMHILTAEMIHLVRQMQYYILFEILEFNWEELTKKLESAESLDDVITAHNQFLDAVRTGAFLDESAGELGHQLRSIYSHIIQLEALEDRLCGQAQAELDAEREREQLIEAEDSGFTLNVRNEAVRRERQEQFQQSLSNARGYLRTLALSYQKHVKKFLTLLAERPDVNLQLLSFRLDFNGHYKRQRKSSTRVNCIDKVDNK